MKPSIKQRCFSLLQRLAARCLPPKHVWISLIGTLICLLGVNFSHPGVAAPSLTCTSAEPCLQYPAEFTLTQAPNPTAGSVEEATLPKQRIADRIANIPIDSPIGIFNLFIIFFVTLGPLKTIPAFVRLTQNADNSLRQQLAFRSAGLATIVIVLVTLVGQNMLRVWNVRLPSLLIAGGVLLFVVALKIVLSEYNPPEKTAPPEHPSLDMAVSPLAFPIIVPPFGIAIALTVMGISQEIGVTPLIVIGLLILVMLLNLIAMLAAKPILVFLKPVTLRILGFALGVLQLAMGIEWIIDAIEIQVLVIRRLLLQN